MKALAAAGLDLVHPFRAGWYEGELPGGFGPEALAYVIGNGRALWEPFVAWARARPELAHPVDAYVESCVREQAGRLGAAHDVAFAHEGPPYLPIQRIAEAAGLCWLSPARLSIHPEHGPWIALRAVVVVDRPGPQGPAPALEPPCHACESACVPALERAQQEPPASPDETRFLPVREACPLGRQHRYGEAQIRYHYGKDRGAIGT